MRLAFNATALLSPLTGIGQYAFHLTGELLKNECIETDFFYGTFWDDKRHISGHRSIFQYWSWVKKYTPYIRSYTPYYTELSRMYRDYLFTKQTKVVKYDVYHEPNYLPLHFKGPTVVTVHDLSWIRYPETHPVERVEMMNRYFEKALSQSSALITDAEFVRQEVIDVFGVKPEKITAIPLGVEPMFIPLTSLETAQVLTSHGLTHGKYFLTVGTLEPRKNLGLAIRAYSELPKSVRDQYPLVVIGMKGWHSSEIERSISPLAQAGYLRQLGYVPREDLTILMAGATALIYPSIYEGFGLPPLEAMACGTPVICSNVSTLPEVVGDAGILIDPSDEVGLRERMYALTEDKKLWADLSSRARERSLRFTWKNCAQQTVEVYKSVIA
jgi:glycosyltransferase involved in cell wall biosynthesis